MIFAPPAATLKSPPLCKWLVTVPLKVTFAPLTLPIVVSTLVAAASVTLPSISTAPADVVKLPFVVIFGAVYVCTPDVFILTTLKFAAVTFTELRA